MGLMSVVSAFSSAAFKETVVKVYQKDVLQTKFFADTSRVGVNIDTAGAYIRVSDVNFYAQKSGIFYVYSGVNKQYSCIHAAAGDLLYSMNVNGDAVMIGAV